MSQIHTEGQMSFPAGAALAVNRRVKIASGVLQYAGATDVAIGTLLNATFADANFASGFTNGTVQLKVSESTHKFTAVNAITAGAVMYGAASGKVSATNNGNVEGIAFETSTADNDVIEGMSSDASDAFVGVTGVAAGYKIARGTVSLDGANPTTVATGLATIVSASAQLYGNVAPGLGTSLVTILYPGGGDLELHAWKPTGAGDTTLIASTGTDIVHWIAIGT